MPAGSSDGSSSRATRASSPVLTSCAGPRAGCPAGDGLVEERLDEPFSGKIGPVDHRRGPGEVESDWRPAREVGEFHQSSGSRTRNPLTIRVRASSVCCAADSPGRSQTRNGSVLVEINRSAAFVIGTGADRQTARIAGSRRRRHASPANRAVGTSPPGFARRSRRRSICRPTGGHWPRLDQDVLQQAEAVGHRDSDPPSLNSFPHQDAHVAPGPRHRDAAAAGGRSDGHRGSSASTAPRWPA